MHQENIHLNPGQYKMRRRRGSGILPTGAGQRSGDEAVSPGEVAERFAREARGGQQRRRYDDTVFHNAVINIHKGIKNSK